MKACFLRYASAGLISLMICTACSKIDKQYGSFKPDRNKSYLSEREADPLQLPEGSQLDLRMAGDRYPIPKGERPAPGAEPVSIIPPTLTKSVGEPQDAES